MTELVWDTYKCECGGTAVMKLVSLVAHCDQCPRVFAAVDVGDRRWFPNIDEANAAYRATQEKRAT
jgi:hypothetical protein